jgi:hypothetical protein
MAVKKDGLMLRRGPLGWCGIFLACLGAAALLGPGCVQLKKTDTTRSATEQLLLSTAADRAAAAADLSEFSCKKVYLDTTNFEGYDSKYAIGALRDALSRAGALLVGEARDSEVTIEARSGVLGTDDQSSLLGLPSFTLPIPFAGGIATPEIGFYKAQEQSATAKFALLAYGTRSREHLYSSGALVGRAFDHYSTIILFTSHKTDVPELQPPPPPPEPEPPAAASQPSPASPP